MINLPGLIARINSELHKEEAIKLGEPCNKTPRKNPLIYRFADREVDSREKFRIYQELDGTCGGVFDDYSEEKIGEILFEKGKYDVGPASSGGYYETLKMRIKVPLMMKNGLVIPDCSIKLHVESEEWAEITPERRDRILAGGLIPWGADLSKLIPTEWFME